MSDDDLPQSLDALTAHAADVVAMLEGGLKAIEARSAELLATLRQAIHHVQQDSTKALADLQKIASQGEAIRKAQQELIQRIDQQWKLDLSDTAAAAGQAHAVALANEIGKGIAEQTRPSYQQMMSAAKAIDQAARHLSWKTAVVAASAGMGLVVAVAALVAWRVPTLDEIASRRAAVAELEQKLASIDLVTCGPKDQYRCVRVDKKVGPQGPLKDLYVVATK